MHSSILSDQEKQTLKQDGFVVLKQAIPNSIVQKAKEHINQDQSKIVHGDEPAINDLYNNSILRDVMLEAMGPHTPPINAQVAVTQPGYNDAVVRSKSQTASAFNPKTHVDGGWAGLCPLTQSEILDSGETLETWGRNEDPKWLGPAGSAPLWQDRDKTCALGSYTAIVGVCLNNQLDPGKGQFSVRRGAHEAVEAFFRMQREEGRTDRWWRAKLAAIATLGN